MTFTALPHHFAVCQVTSLHAVDWDKEYVFVAKTDDELSVVCEASSVPPDAQFVDLGWKALKILGVLDFSMVGVISNISGILAAHGISVFVVSTYNTDYVLIKEAAFAQAARHLTEAGHRIEA